MAQAVGGLFKERHAATEGSAEAFLFLAQRLHDHGLGSAQLRIGRAHFLHQGGRQTVHQGLGRAQQMGVAHGPTHDPAQHIATAFIGRRHAVGDKEGRGAQMVGNHAV